MLLTHRKPRPLDLGGEKTDPRTINPRAVIQALHMAHGRSPIKTARKALAR